MFAIWVVCFWDKNHRECRWNDNLQELLFLILLISYINIWFSQRYKPFLRKNCNCVIIWGMKSEKSTTDWWVLPHHVSHHHWCCMNFILTASKKTWFKMFQVIDNCVGIVSWKIGSIKYIFHCLQKCLFSRCQFYAHVIEVKLELEHCA